VGVYTWVAATTAAEEEEAAATNDEKNPIMRRQIREQYKNGERSPGLAVDQ
jgi:hypothetical protein